jgi:hypothetical protein
MPAQKLRPLGVVPVYSWTAANEFAATGATLLPELLQLLFPTPMEQERTEPPIVAGG